MTILSYAPSITTQHPGANQLSLATAVGQTYSLTLKNSSAYPWTFYVYQQAPQPSPNIFSLAWFASPFVIMPGNQITFQWNITYGFVWGSSGSVIPGVVFQASGTQAADLVSANSTKFTVSPGPYLTTPVAGTPAGSLIIADQSDVPNNVFTVGISMSGTGTYVTSAGANLTHLFTPTPSYWIAAGQNVQVGTILNIDTITQNTQVIFPANVYALQYTLNQSNQWVPGLV